MMFVKQDREHLRLPSCLHIAASLSLSPSLSLSLSLSLLPPSHRLSVPLTAVCWGLSQSSRLTVDSLITAIRQAETSRNWEGLTGQTVPREGSLFLGTCSQERPSEPFVWWIVAGAEGPLLHEQPVWTWRISFLFNIWHDGTTQNLMFSLTFLDYS